MEKGFTNPAIAAEIGYSESLVRQETMAIYSLLDISGRKELLERKPN
jgi:DNA-binding NarL/FixJ family response regulator